MSIKSKIWEKLEEDGYITDSELAKIYGREPNFYTAEVYKAEYFALQKAKERFAELENNPNTIIRKANRKYLIRDSMWENLNHYQIPKCYYLYLKNKGVKEV